MLSHNLKPQVWNVSPYHCADNLSDHSPVTCEFILKVDHTECYPRCIDKHIYGLLLQNIACSSIETM